jgi:hypothetical protein
MPTPRADFEHAYRATPRRRLTPAARRRIAETLGETEAQRERSIHGQHSRQPFWEVGVARWKLVVACLTVAAATHVLTRWTTDRRVEPARPASLAPVTLSVDAAVFPTRYQTRIRSWQHAMPDKEHSQ